MGIARWFAREAVRVYGIGGVDDSAENAGLVQELLALMREQGGRITVRELSRRSRRFGETADEVEECLRNLVKSGLAHTEVSSTGKKGRQRVDYVLNGTGVDTNAEN